MRRAKPTAAPPEVAQEPAQEPANVQPAPAPSHDPGLWDGPTCGSCHWAFQMATADEDGEVRRDPARCYESPPSDRGRPYVALIDPACSRFKERQ